MYYFSPEIIPQQNKEINTIVDKILRGIGEKAMETATVVETNAANNVEIEDIFGAIEDKSNSEDVSIF